MLTTNDDAYTTQGIRGLAVPAVLFGLAGLLYLAGKAFSGQVMATGTVVERLGMVFAGLAVLFTIESLVSKTKWANTPLITEDSPYWVLAIIGVCAIGIAVCFAVYSGVHALLVGA